MNKLLINKNKGFTLIEMLAVLAVFGVIGILSTSILITALRTTNKTNSLSSVKQNGDFVLTQLAQSLRDARYIKSPFPCVVISPTPPLVSTSISFVAADGGNITYACENSTDNPPSTIASNGASILDNSVKLVNNSCFFTCSQNNLNDYPLININFSLIQSSNSSFTENTASKTAVPFTTSVLMRNLMQ